jgi:hypothetical protein
MSGSHPPRRWHLIVPICFLAVGSVACTASTGSSSAIQTPGPGVVPTSPEPTITVQGRPYNVHCQPVAEALLDVRISDPGAHPFARAITGLWFQQAVAVLAHDPKGPCGLWTLAVSPNLSPAALAAIDTEVKQGVANFGVTASPVPKDPNNGMSG